ncbi:MAG: leucine--tRNA ligase [Candidatus Thorarchaeota archaeon]
MSELHRIETKWQRRWRRDRVFEADPDPSRPKFFLTVPYPYTNGALHVGHGRTYTVGDLIARYKRMRGYNVLFPMASHMTGTPIQGMVERLKAGDRDAIELYKRDLRVYLKTEEEVNAQLAKFTDPWVTARFFADAISSDFNALGYSIDWRRRFTTGDGIYNKFIEWQYGKFKEKGYIRQGNYPLLYCPRDKNPVGEDDLLEGSSAKIKEFTAIKFGFEDGYIVPATLRPETIFGVTNMWVNPSADYVWAKVNGEKWVVSEAAVEKLRLQAKNVEVIERFKGSRLVNKRFRAVHDEHEGLILPADFVDPNNATGVVYSVPAHAPFDYVALRDLWEDPTSLAQYGITPEDIRGILPIGIIDIKGYGEFPAKEEVEKRGIRSQHEVQALEEATQEIYKAEFYGGVMKNNCGEFAGRPIRDAKDEVVSWMRSNGRCDVFYEPDIRPVICKCGAEVQVGVFAGQWFLDYQSPGWKDLARRALDSMTIVPDVYRRLFEATFDWLTQRPCARKRGIGTRLPFDPDWIIESLSDSTIYMAFYTIAHIITANRIKPENLVPEVFDFVFLDKGKVEDVATASGISADILRAMHDEFAYWYPNDQRHTAPSHISNHLSFAIFHHVAIFPERHWLRCISLNEHVNMEGAKMSKSKGNTIPLAEIPVKYGADVYRTYTLSAAEPGTLMDWREKEIPTVRTRLQQFFDTVLKYGRKTPRVYRESDRPTLATRWILSRVNSIIEACTDCIERFKIRDYAILASSEMERTISRYLRMGDVPRQERDGTMAYVCDIWVRLMAPMTPHLSEELWSRMKREGYVSLARWPEADKSLIDTRIEIAQNVVDSTIGDVREIVRLLRNKSVSRVHLYVAPQWMFDAMNSIRDAQLPLVMSSIMKHLMSQSKFREHGKELSRIVERIAKENGLWPYSENAELELETMRNASGYMSSQLGFEVIVHSAESPEYDPQGKSALALPGRVSVLLE